MVSESKIITIEEPLKIRNELLGLNTRKEIIETALEILIKKTNCKIASIFLFSKKGLLERFGIKGTDANNLPIDDSKFFDEVYEVGIGITGQAADPAKAKGHDFGKTQYSLNPSIEEIKEYGKFKYLSILEKIKTIISIPLNGQSKTYGVLEVINDSEFSDEEVAWLSAIQSYVATALSNFRRDKQTRILTELGNLLVNFDDSIYNFDNEVNKLYRKFIKRLVSPETSFQVCILRLRDDRITDNLSVKAIESCDPKLLEGRKDDDRKFGTGFVWDAVKTRQPIIIEDINLEIHDFINKNWIEKQKFKSFGCFPLVTKKEVLGTLSLFIGYNYNFHESCRSFLKTVTSQLASFEESLRQSKRVRLLQGEENYIHEKEKALNHIFNNYKEAKTINEEKRIIEVKHKDEQIKNQNIQIKHLRQLIENLTT